MNARDVIRPHFMLATGIDTGCPTIALPDGSTRRLDGMATSGHYGRWQEDFDRVEEQGIEFLRYGPPYYQVHKGPGVYDWEFADLTFRSLRDRHITPIADLCHFGLPDWLGDFQNPDFPHHFAEYAKAFAERYPWVFMFTPISEILLTALFSARHGRWNERLSSDKAFVTAIKHACRANLLAMQAITSVCPDAVFIQSEAIEYAHGEDPGSLARCRFLNDRRFLSFDLTYGHPVSAGMYQYLRDHGMTDAEYCWFGANRGKANCVIGTDYDEINEHLADKDGRLRPAGEVYGYYTLCRQYYDRYRLPLMHTGTGMVEERSVAWLKKQWAHMVRLRQDGIPIIGFTWCSLTDRVDRDTALGEDGGRFDTVGLYDLDRKIRLVGDLYRKLIRDWRDFLSTDSTAVTLDD